MMKEEWLTVSDYETRLKEMIKDDRYIMSILTVVESLNLHDAWVCAGLIRNKVWDTLHNTTTSVNDIDVIYFDTSDTSIEKEQQIETELEGLFPNQSWEVKNQARMHLKNGFATFNSSYDGVAHFPETPTAIAVRRFNQEFEIMAPYGLNDLFELKVKPTPFYQKNSKFHSIYLARVETKRWKEIWRNLSIEF